MRPNNETLWALQTIPAGGNVIRKASKTSLGQQHGAAQKQVRDRSHHLRPKELAPGGGTRDSRTLDYYSNCNDGYCTLPKKCLRPSLTNTRYGRTKIIPLIALGILVTNTKCQGTSKKHGQQQSHGTSTRGFVLPRAYVQGPSSVSGTEWRPSQQEPPACPSTYCPQDRHARVQGSLPQSPLSSHFAMAPDDTKHSGRRKS